MATTNERMPEARSAGSSNGKLIHQSVRQAPAPAMRAASSSVASIARNAGWTKRNNTVADRTAPSTMSPVYEYTLMTLSTPGSTACSH